MNLIFKQTLGLALLASLGLSQRLAAQTTEPNTVRIVLKGMVCAYCAHGLTQRLNTRPELESVQVRLASRDAIIKIKPARQLAEADLRQAASDAGLQVERIEYSKE